MKIGFFSFKIIRAIKMSKSKSAKLARERFKSAARRVRSEEFIWDIDGSKTFVTKINKIIAGTFF